MTDSNATLLPCPWCGKDAELDRASYGHRVRCANAKCPVNAFTLTFRTKEEAIEAWNRRAS